MNTLTSTPSDSNSVISNTDNTDTLKPTFSSSNGGMVDEKEKLLRQANSKEKWSQLVLEKALRSKIYQEEKQICLSTIDWAPFLEVCRKDIHAILKQTPSSMLMGSEEEIDSVIQHVQNALNLPRHRNHFLHLLDTTGVDQPVLNSFHQAIETAILEVEKDQEKSEEHPSKPPSVPVDS